MRILLIEDNSHDVERVLRSFASGELARHVTMEVVVDGHAAVEHVFGDGNGSTSERLERAPHLVLLDLKLPRMDGTEVLRALKGDPRTRRIPVVVLTAMREARTMQLCYEMGVNSYVVKPQKAEHFEKVVREVGLYWVHLNEPPTH